MADLPRFDDLPEVPGLGLRHAWDVFGPDDRCGMINLLDASRVVAAAALVRSGEVLSLDLPLDLPDPPLFGRKPYRHDVFTLSRNEMDDRLDDFHLQGSTQWDALGHVRCREHGFWGGRTTNPTSAANDLGIEHWAEHGIVGRGVLVDVAGWAAASGRPFDALTGTPITVGDLHAVLDHQDTRLEPGDILCLRTGWVGAYKALDPAARVAYADEPVFSGLRADEDTARFLWDAHAAAVVCDNPAVEVVPGDPAVGSLHRRLIPLLGLALGEMFDLEALAQRCRDAARWVFMFVAVPLKVRGGIGSPGNAVAIL
jgi:kynurenine formamidase